MLQNLAESANVDDDSVLGSQRPQESVHGDTDNEEELSQPLGAVSQDDEPSRQEECGSRYFSSACFIT